MKGITHSDLSIVNTFYFYVYFYIFFLQKICCGKSNRNTIVIKTKMETKYLCSLQHLGYFLHKKHIPETQKKTVKVERMNKKQKTNNGKAPQISTQQWRQQFEHHCFAVQQYMCSFRCFPIPVQRQPYYRNVGTLY